MTPLLEYVLDRFNSRAAAMLVGAVLTFAGIVLTVMEIRSEGFIDIKSPFLSGKLESGLVGVLPVLLGTLVVLASVLARNKHLVEVKIGDHQFKFQGHASDRRMRQIREGIHELIEHEARSDQPKK